MKATRILALLAVALPLAFVSCSDDDDDDNGGGSSSGSAWVDESGTYNVYTTVLEGNDGTAYQLASVYEGSYKIYAYDYDTDSRWISVYDWGDQYRLNFNDDGSFKGLTPNDGIYSFSMSFNADGYVSKFSFTETSESEYESGTGQEMTTYSYTDGYLTQVSMSSWGNWKDDDGSYTESSNYTLTLTWVDGNLIKMDGSSSESSDGDTWYGADTYTYEYGNERNDSRQFLAAISEMVEGDYDDFIWLLGMPGLLGKGPVNLPTSCTNVSTYNEDGEEGRDEYSYRFSYTKGSNGLISTEKFDGTTYTYYYVTFGDNTRSAVTSPFEEASSTSAKAKGMSRHSKHEKMRGKRKDKITVTEQ